MAKKAQTPPPPRRPQAPRTRTGDRGGPGGRRKWLLPAIVVAVGLIALAVAAGVWALGGGTSASEQLQAAGCEVQTFPAQAADHVEELPEGFEYNSDPPTTGPHHPIAAPWGIYDEPIEQIRLVHNLEHGGVIVQYGDDVAEEDVNALIDWYRDDPTGLVLAPREELGSSIALGAWNADELQPGESEQAGRGILARCDGFDADAFDTFRDEYGFQGPERFPPDSLRPDHS